METLLIALLLLYNAYLVFYLLREKRQQGQKPSEKDTGFPERQTTGTEDIVGKSLFKMEGKMPQPASQVPQAAIFKESEDIADMDVTFADETGEPFPVRLPDDMLDEVFSDIRISDIPVEYGENETEEDASDNGYATGASFDEIGQAVETADSPVTTKEESRHAGRVFTELEGNELFKQLVKSSPLRAKRITGLMDYFLNNPSPGEGAVAREEARPRNITEVPPDISRFDIRDFV